MSWAGAAMAAVNTGIATNENLFKQATVVVGIIAEDMLMLTFFFCAVPPYRVGADMRPAEGQLWIADA